LLALSVRSPKAVSRWEDSKNIQQDAAAVPCSWILTNYCVQLAGIMALNSRFVAAVVLVLLVQAGG
jgi:hypothetical protein